MLTSPKFKPLTSFCTSCKLVSLLAKLSSSDGDISTLPVISLADSFGTNEYDSQIFSMPLLEAMKILGSNPSALSFSVTFKSANDFGSATATATSLFFPPEADPPLADISIAAAIASLASASGISFNASMLTGDFLRSI